MILLQCLNNRFSPEIELKSKVITLVRSPACRQQTAVLSSSELCGLGGLPLSRLWLYRCCLLLQAIMEFQDVKRSYNYPFQLFYFIEEEMGVHSH